MKLNVLVVGLNHEVWFRDTRDERQVVTLNCLDRDAHLSEKLKQTFDYNPTQEEASEIDLEKLDGEKLVLAVREIKAANGGRLSMRGKIDRASVPAAAIKNGNGSPVPVKGSAKA